MTMMLYGRGPYLSTSFEVMPRARSSTRKESLSLPQGPSTVLSPINRICMFECLQLCRNVLVVGSALPPSSIFLPFVSGVEA